MTVDICFEVVSIYVSKGITFALKDNNAFKASN